MTDRISCLAISIWRLAVVDWFSLILVFIGTSPPSHCYVQYIPEQRIKKKFMKEINWSADFLMRVMLWYGYIWFIESWYSIAIYAMVWLYMLWCGYICYGMAIYTMVWLYVLFIEYLFLHLELVFPLLYCNYEISNQSYFNPN